MDLIQPPSPPHKIMMKRVKRPAEKKERAKLEETPQNSAQDLKSCLDLKKSVAGGCYKRQKLWISMYFWKIKMRKSIF
jgi:hypothetical protein